MVAEGVSHGVDGGSCLRRRMRGITIGHVALPVSAQLRSERAGGLPGDSRVCSLTPRKKMVMSPAACHRRIAFRKLPFTIQELRRWLGTN